MRSAGIMDVAHTYNESVKLIHNNNYKKAFTLLRQCLDVFEFKEGLVNIGNCYRTFGNDKKMFECYKRANSPDVPYLLGATGGDYTHALNNLGLAYFMFGDDTAAIECYDRCLAIDPNFADALWNKSTATLRKACSGSHELFDKGWELYDARFIKTPPVKLKNNKHDLVYWDRKSRVDKLIVLAEQGIGDNIMWGRYLSWLRDEYCNELYVQCDPSLDCVFSDFNPVRDAIETDCTYAVPMCSISKVFGSNIPSGDWLRGKFGKREFDEENFNIGIVWAGSGGHANDAYRSTNIHRFHRFAKYANLWALSPGFKSTKYVRSLGNKTWTDTAECINGLDLVISVDTSVVHFAGSLGAECWMLQPMKETDFRWGTRLDSKNVWYDSVRVFHNPNDWEFVFDQVEDTLKEKLYVK